MFTPVKECSICKKKYKKNPDIGFKQWDKSKFCSPKCRGLSTPWNKGKKGTQTANKGSFKKGEHKSSKTEFKKGYDVTSHWNWKGGITPIKMIIRNSPEMKEWRTLVFERDNYTCTWCSKRSGNGKKVILQADHIKPFGLIWEENKIINKSQALMCKELWDVKNGRTLCKDCHEMTGSHSYKFAIFKPNQVKPFVAGKDRISYGGAVLGYEEVDAIFKVINSQGGRRWTIGPESVAMEKELAARTGMKYSVLTNSGSSALLVGIAALHLPKGSKVIVPAVNFPTAFNSILQNGLIPLVVDVDMETLNIDLLQVKEAMNEFNDISAVIAVDIAGNPVDLKLLRKVVGKKIKIILDNCDGYGTKLNGKFIDTYADISCVSFHAAHIITMGEGGAVLTNDEKTAKAATKIREWGRASGTDKIYKYKGFPKDYKERYVYEEIGYNVKPLELQCAMGRVQLKRLEGFVTKRMKNYEALSKVFAKYPQFRVIKAIDNSYPCWFSFPIMCEDIERGLVMETLEKNNIECRTIFSGNILRHPAYKDIKYCSVGDMPNADLVMEKGMFLSCHPSIVPDMIRFIDKVIGQLCS